VLFNWPMEWQVKLSGVRQSKIMKSMNFLCLLGACEGTLSCSTCHLIFDPDEHAMLDLTPADDEELDMLDLAYGLTPT
jgi:ferredoxin